MKDDEFRALTAYLISIAATLLLQHFLLSRLHFGSTLTVSLAFVVFTLVMWMLLSVLDRLPGRPLRRLILRSR